jgi:hypothetical protein
MLNARIPAMRNQPLIGIGLFLLSLWLAWEVGGKIAADDERPLVIGVLVLAACMVSTIILRNWRTGFYLFFVWMMFEDLLRKYMGNDLALFFGKDVLLALVYLAFFVEVRRHKEKAFRPRFLLFFSLFFWLGVLQVFNQNSPHILYGLLGFKLDFYYVPLLFIGYALIRNDADLRKFLVTNALLAGVIATLGIIQAIVGNSFLNPAHLAPELEDLGNLTKSTPLSGQMFSLPDSVFVSSGRFAMYLLVAFILMMGAVGYLLLSSGRGRRLAFIAIGLLGGATLLAGNRGSFVYVAATALVLSGAFLWGAPLRRRQTHGFVRAIRRSCIVGALALGAILLVFPKDAGSRIAYYTETLNPNSSAYEAGFRAWDYPIHNLLAVFDQPHWVMGNGIGTATLGRQYVSKVTGKRPPDIGVEEGYGSLILEMGIVAPFLWILWTAALLYYSWKVVGRLRGTRLFPIAVAIFWYAFLLLYPITFGGLSSYQNYICNAYLWILVGILFRLPEVLESPPGPITGPWDARKGLKFQRTE